MKTWPLAARIARWLALLALIAAVALSPLRSQRVILAQPALPVFREYTDLFLYPSDYALLGVLAFWLASLALSPRPVSLRPIPLTMALAGLTLASLFSAFFSPAPLLSFYHTARLGGLFAMYLFLVNEGPGLWLLAGAAGLLVLTQSSVGIAQVILQHSLGLAALGELPLDPSWKGVSILWRPGASFLRAYGLSDHPNILGGCLAFALIFLAAGYLKAQPAWRPVLAVLFGLGAAGLLVTFSRSAWLGLAGGMAILALFLLAGRRAQDLPALAGLGAGSLLFLLPFFLAQSPLLASRANLNGSFEAPTPENQAIHERSLLNAEALRIFSRRPLAGVGIGAYPLALRQAEPDYPFDYQPPHLVLLDVAVETGLLGATSYAILLLLPWALLWFNRSRLAFSLPLAAASAALLAISLVSLLDYYPWMLNAGRTWQWLLWGAWGAAYVRVQSKVGND